MMYLLVFTANGIGIRTTSISSSVLFTASGVVGTGLGASGAFDGNSKGQESGDDDSLHHWGSGRSELVTGWHELGDT